MFLSAAVDAEVIASIDAKCTPRESRALRVLAWALRQQPRHSSLKAESVRRMIRRAAQIPTTIPSSEHHASLNMPFSCSCPRLALLMQCPNGRSVAASMAGLSCSADIAVHQYINMPGTCADSTASVTIDTLLVRCRECVCTYHSEACASASICDIVQLWCLSASD
jgi:hypothetical protein